MACQVNCGMHLKPLKPPTFLLSGLNYSSVCQRDIGGTTTIFRHARAQKSRPSGFQKTHGRSTRLWRALYHVLFRRDFRRGFLCTPLKTLKDASSRNSGSLATPSAIPHFPAPSGSRQNCLLCSISGRCWHGGFQSFLRSNRFPRPFPCSICLSKAA